MAESGAEQKQGWIGVDLDGTLAHYTEWQGADHIGQPVVPMLERVKGWLADGLEVRIMTARVHPSHDDAEVCRETIKEWTLQHLGQELVVTHEKDFYMMSLWDDRAVQVCPNTGQLVAEVKGIITQPLIDKAREAQQELETMSGMGWPEEMDTALRRAILVLKLVGV